MSENTSSLGFDKTRVMKKTLQNDILTYEQRELFEVIIYVFCSNLICLLGVPANIINIAVFIKQGFNLTMNISFCGLAISDFTCLLIQLWFNLCNNPLFKKADIPFVPHEVLYLTGGTPMVCFGRITAWITVFVTAERCLCIALPLRVKQIITENRTLVIIVLIYVLNFMTIVPIYPNYYFGRKFYHQQNRSLVGLIVKNNDLGADALGFILTSLSGLFSFFAVIVFTIILVVKLGQTSAWRKKVTSANEKSDSLANRDKKAVKMIIVIASVMIICYIPGTIFTMVTFIEPEFSVLGRYSNTFFALWSFGCLFQNVNSSVNILLYYRMSTKFRQTFQEMFATK